MEAKPMGMDGWTYLLHARHFAQTIPLSPQENQWETCPLVWQRLGDLPVIPQLVRSRVGIWPWPAHPSVRPCLYPSCSCWFLGMRRPSVLQAGSAQALPPCRQPGRHKDRSASVGSTAQRGCGAGRPGAEVRAQGRLTGDSSPAGRQSGSLTTSAPGVPRPCALPKAGRENLAWPAPPW